MSTSEPSGSDKNDKEKPIKVNSVKRMFEKAEKSCTAHTDMANVEKRRVKMSATIELLQKKLHSTQDRDQARVSSPVDLKQNKIILGSKTRCTWITGTFSGSTRKRSKSRYSTTSRKTSAAAPAPSNKKERPYRQWLGVSSCVTADSKFIVSSKPSRHDFEDSNLVRIDGSKLNGQDQQTGKLINPCESPESSSNAAQTYSINNTNKNILPNATDYTSRSKVSIEESNTTDAAQESLQNKALSAAVSQRSNVGSETVERKKVTCKKPPNGQSPNEKREKLKKNPQCVKNVCSSITMTSTVKTISVPSCVASNVDADFYKKKTILKLTCPPMPKDCSIIEKEILNISSSKQLNQTVVEKAENILLNTEKDRGQIVQSFENKNITGEQGNAQENIDAGIASIETLETSANEVISDLPSRLETTNRSAATCGRMESFDSASPKEERDSLHALPSFTCECNDTLVDCTSNLYDTEQPLSGRSWQEVTDDESLNSEAGFKVRVHPGVSSFNPSPFKPLTWKTRMEKSESLKSYKQYRIDESGWADFKAHARWLKRSSKNKEPVIVEPLVQKKITPEHSTTEVSYIKGLSTPETKRKLISVSPHVVDVRRPLLRTAARASHRSRQESPCTNNTDTAANLKRTPMLTARRKRDISNDQPEQKSTKTHCSIATETEVDSLDTLPSRYPPNSDSSSNKLSNSLQRARNKAEALHFSKHSKYKSVVARQLLQKINWTRRHEQKPEYKLVQAIVDLRGNLPGQLSFQKGQVIRQRCDQEPQATDLCYGSYSVSRLKKRRKGLFPAYCVIDYSPPT